MESTNPLSPADPIDPAVTSSTPEKAEGARIVGVRGSDGPGPDVMAAASFTENEVYSSDGEHVGKISDIMLDVRSGKIAYAVLSEGGFLGMGTTLHAIPWNALTFDAGMQTFRVDIPAEQLRNDPGFDKDHWPLMGDPQWGSTVHQFFGRQPYWNAPRDFIEDEASKYPYPPEER